LEQAHTRDKRTKGLELAGNIAQAASDLGVENVSLVPGAVHIPWRDGYEPVRNDICDRRAKEAVKKLIYRASSYSIASENENADSTFKLPDHRPKAQ
jgi:hexulose-6-phosphate isomerase